MKSIRPAPRSAFTIIEVMAAILIFGLVVMAIYSTWIAILRGSRVGLEAAAEVQRSRIAMRTIEDALLTAQLVYANIGRYAFVADTTGETAFLTMVSRLPASFPGVGRYQDQIVRRVSFSVQSGSHGPELVMAQAPMLVDTNSIEPYSLVLARDVTRFQLEFWNLQKQEWEEEWEYTNALPALVKVTLGLGRKGSRGSEPHDEVSRIVSIPGSIITPDLQGRGSAPPGVVPGVPGVNFPNPNLPNPNFRAPQIPNPNFSNPRFRNPPRNR